MQGTLSLFWGGGRSRARHPNPGGLCKRERAERQAYETELKRLKRPAPLSEVAENLMPCRRRMIFDKMNCIGGWGTGLLQPDIGGANRNPSEPGGMDRGLSSTVHDSCRTGCGAHTPLQEKCLETGAECRLLRPEPDLQARRTMAATSDRCRMPVALRQEERAGDRGGSGAVRGRRRCRHRHPEVWGCCRPEA